MIGKTVSHYDVVSRIGVDGMRIVYKAEHTILKRSVALKVLAASLVENPESRLRFLSEVQTASAINPPNICTVDDFLELE
jgi:eukaryotic-like serine/threonine-protein kinase